MNDVALDQLADSETEYIAADEFRIVRIRADGSVMWMHVDPMPFARCEVAIAGIDDLVIMHEEQIDDLPERPKERFMPNRAWRQLFMRQFTNQAERAS